MKPPEVMTVLNPRRRRIPGGLSALSIRSLREDFHRDLLNVGHAAGVKDDLNAWENVAMGSRLSGKPCSQDDALEALVQVGLLSEAGAPALSTSEWP